MKNRDCPYCQGSTISRKKLAFQALCMPGVVCECVNCNAVVSVKSSDNLLWAITLEIIVFMLAVASTNLFGGIWWGVFLFVIWRISKFLAGLNGQLEYIR